MSVERDDTHCVPVQGRTLNGIKAELIRAFLTVRETFQQETYDSNDFYENNRAYHFRSTNYPTRWSGKTLFVWSTSAALRTEAVCSAEASK